MTGITEMKIEKINPEMKRVGDIETGTSFFRKSDNSIYRTIGENCHIRILLKHEEDVKVVENPIVVYNISLNLITVMNNGEWVVIAKNVKLTATA